MIIRCIDFETTGFPPRAGVCEVGWTDLTACDGGWAISETRAFITNPGMPIGAEAMAVHGITEDDVAGAPPSATLFRQLVDGADVFVAHNCEFERNWFGGSGRPWICTYKVALRLHPNLPNHRCGTVPEHLGIELDPARSAPLHRAGPDTYFTALILERFLRDGATIAELIAISKAPRHIVRMPFGKHRGMHLSELPADYLSSAARNIDAPDVRAALAAELKRRQQQ